MNVIRYETSRELFPFFKKYHGPVIFLAGPTVRGNQPHLVSWRGEAIREFQRQGFEGTLIIPEFVSKQESDQYRYDIPTWEFAGMDISDCVMFWIPRTRELIGLTTNFEIGRWLGQKEKPIVYGRPDDAYRMKYVDIIWDHLRKEGNYDYHTDTWSKKTFHNTLPDTVREAIAHTAGVGDIPMPDINTYISEYFAASNLQTPEAQLAHFKKTMGEMSVSSTDFWRLDEAERTQRILSVYALDFYNEMFGIHD